jgi:hypothetical protein
MVTDVPEVALSNWDCFPPTPLTFFGYITPICPVLIGTNGK